MVGIVPQRMISIKKDKNGCEISLVEFLNRDNGHGLRIIVSQNNKVEIYGFGSGFPSYINMFQGNGTWHWATVEDERIGRFMKMHINSCEDVANVIYTVVSMTKDPVLMLFAEKFVKRYSMHGRVHCIDIEST